MLSWVFRSAHTIVMQPLQAQTFRELLAAILLPRAPVLAPLGAEPGQQTRAFVGAVLLWVLLQLGAGLPSGSAYPLGPSRGTGAGSVVWIKCVASLRGASCGLPDRPAFHRVCGAS